MESDSQVSPDICKHGSQAARDEEKPTYSCVVLLRFPRLSGMVPVSWLLARFLQQWEHEVETMQRKVDKDEVRY